MVRYAIVPHQSGGDMEENIFPTRRISQFLSSSERKEWIDDSVQFTIMKVRFVEEFDAFNNQNWHLTVKRRDTEKMHILTFRHTQNTKRAIQMEYLSRYFSSGYSAYGPMMLCSRPSEKKGFKDLQYLALVEYVEQEETNE